MCESGTRWKWSDIVGYQKYCHGCVPAETSHRTGRLSRFGMYNIARFCPMSIWRWFRKKLWCICSTLSRHWRSWIFQVTLKLITLLFDSGFSKIQRINLEINNDTFQLWAVCLTPMGFSMLSHLDTENREVNLKMCYPCKESLSVTVHRAVTYT